MQEKRVVFTSYLKLSFLFLFLLLLKSAYFHFFPERIFTAYYPKIIYQKKVLSELGQKNRILIIGDSLAVFNLNSSDLSADSLNLGLFGATYIEVYWSLKKYLENNPLPQKIILLNGQNWEYKRGREFWQYFVGFNFYSLAELVSLKTSDNNLFTPMKWLFYRSGIPNFDLTLLKNSLWNGSEIARNNQFIEQLLMKEKGSIVLRNRYPLDRPVVQPYHQQYYSGLSVSPENDYYFKEVLKLAQEKQIPLVMIEPPLMPSYQEDPDIQEFKNQYRQYHQEILSEFNFHYCRDNKTLYQDEDFLDLDHLLLSGAKKFASFVKDCL